MAEQDFAPALPAPTRDYNRSSQGESVAERRGDKSLKRHFTDSSSSSLLSKKSKGNKSPKTSPRKHKSTERGECSKNLLKRKHSRHSPERSGQSASNFFAAGSCVAHRTRSKTDFGSNSNTAPSGHSLDWPAHSSSSNQSLHPLQERDYANSPFSSSTVTDLIDSDHSVYSPNNSKSKIKKRKHSSSKVVSKPKVDRKFSFLKNLEKEREGEGGPGRKTTASFNSGGQESERSSSLYPHIIPYSLRSRNSNPAPSTSSVSNSKSAISLQTKSSSSKEFSKSKLLQLKAASKTDIELPYLRQTNARRSIAAAANLGSCLTRSSGTRQQRRDASSKSQLDRPAESATSADMPQPRRQNKGKSSLGSCASSGGGRREQPPVNSSAVASTSATQQSVSSATSGDGGSSTTSAKAKGKAWTEEESSSEEGDVGRLQALLEARGLPPHLLGALGPRVHHLLHRTCSLSTASSKAASLLTGLQAAGDESQQLQACIEMCQLLVMGNEDTLAGFPVRQVVHALVNLLSADHNFDMMNHACRALTYMMEALPRSSGAVVMAVPAFLDKLQAISCMDVAEQSLTALDMLSRRHAKPILQAQGVSACLTYLDFFSINAQRAALSITSNCCQNLTPDEFHYIKDTLSLLTSRLTHEDKKSVEFVCSAFSRIVDSYQKNPELILEVATTDLLTNLQQLLVVSPAALSSSTFIVVVRVLWSMCGACAGVAVALQRLRFADTLLQLLRQPERSSHELYELTGLLAELLPKLPSHENVAVEALDSAVTTAEPIDPNDERITIVRSSSWRASGAALLSALQDVYAASAGPGVRAQCVRAMLRLVYYADTVALADMLNMQVMASLLAGMLGSGDARLAAGALQLADVLMARMPVVAADHFRREGVTHQVLQLAQHQTNPGGSISLQSSPQPDLAITPLSQSAPSEESILAVLPETSQSRSSHSLQLVDVLKRKRAPKRCSLTSVTKQTSHEFRTSKTSFLSSLHPGRWARTRPTEPETMHNRRALREWVRNNAARLARAWGVAGADGARASDEPAALSRLASALSADPRRAFAALRDTLVHHHVSPFQVNHSGIIDVLLQYLTTADSNNLRIFLNVFAGLPISEEWGTECAIEADSLAALVSAVMAALAQREQLPVRVHELRSDTSALKFFNTHQLTCDLKRHPDCTDLKQWKGGVVRIDPLALVQAIERYLAGRGYARTRDASSDDASDDDAELTPLNPSEHKLEFLIGDTVLPYNMTVYQAIRQYGDHSDTDTDTEAPLGSGGIWAQTHTIHYRAAAPPAPPQATRKGKGQSAKSRRNTDTLWNDGSVIPPESALTGALREASNWSREGATAAGGAGGNALSLLRALHAISRYWHCLYREPSLLQPLLPAERFISTKLTAKANRQLQDPLVIMTGNLPAWLQQIAIACPFVFPFDCRQLLFYVVSFDRERALQRLLEAGGSAAPEGDRPAPRLERRRRAVTRHHLLKQAERLLADLEPRPLLEVQYEGEVGTGLGPTLEFYALVSLELQRADLDLWYGSDNFKRSPALGRDAVKSPPPGAEGKDDILKPLEGGEVVVSSCGLYPAPLGRNARASLLSRVKAKFRFLGKLMAKAVMDSRMVDLPLSPAFYRWLVGDDRWLELGDVRHVSPELWRSLVRLRILSERAKEIERDTSMTPEHKMRELESLELDGCPIEELGLAMMLPGARDVELRRGGRDASVTAHNLADYVALVTHWTLREGVQRQMDAFREGFETVFPLSNLRMFYPEELEMIFCGCPAGNDARWDVRALAECVRADHGYTSDSRTIRMLLEILSTYERDERRLFLQFVTGSPRLPTGGLKSLNPPLTVVRKTTDGPADTYLPSVMTCVNYLKLPEYSGADVMRARLRLAALEGQHSFHLS